jgi:uncharacterized protein (DUF2267 family)
VDDRRQAYRVLRGFLHLLRDRLPTDEGAHLAAQLPHFLRGVFYDDRKPNHSPQTFRNREQILERLADAASLSGPTEASLALDACGRVLRRHVSEGEVRDVLQNLPDALRAPLSA